MILAIWRVACGKLRLTTSQGSANQPTSLYCQGNRTVMLKPPVSDYVTYLRRVRVAAREIRLDNLNEMYRKALKGVVGQGVSRNLVPGDGNMLARLMIIGEAPGKDEDKERRPFVGRAGALLDHTLERVGITRADDCYVTNVLKFRPPDNRDPSPDEVTASLWFLAKEVAIIKPDLVVPMGRFANMLFFQNFSVSQINGKMFVRNGWPVIPTYHPAAALHDKTGNVKREFRWAYQQVKAALDEIAAGRQVRQKNGLVKMR